jgi:drug/metabolite transporter (DMT)-like permease
VILWAAWQRAVLRERVTRWQGIGMAMAMGSVAMIAAG